jgi:hypothetical protein
MPAGVADVYFAPAVPGVTKLYANVVDTSQGRLDLIGPLYQHYRSPIAKVIEAEHLKLGDIVQPISVHVEDVKSPRILVDDHKCRTRDHFAVISPGACTDALNQMGLAAAQLSANSYYRTASKLRAQPATEFYRLLRRI